MKAQVLYDLQEKHAFCSEHELHNFFLGVRGNPAPSGGVEINDTHARNFVLDKVNAMIRQSPRMEAYCDKVLDDFDRAAA